MCNLLQILIVNLPFILDGNNIDLIRAGMFALSGGLVTSTGGQKPFQHRHAECHKLGQPR